MPRTSPMAQLVVHFSVSTISVFQELFFFSSRRRHTRSLCDWSSEVCSSDLLRLEDPAAICELIASTIGIAEGKVDFEHLADDLREAGSSAAAARAVRKTLVEVAE